MTSVCVCEGVTFVFSLHFQIHSFEWEEEGMAAGPVLGTKVFTHLQEREGKGKKATQMRPMKKKQIGSTAGGKRGERWKVRGWGSEGKPFHQVLEIQAAGS